jgi:hypothetical protein
MAIWSKLFGRKGGSLERAAELERQAREQEDRMRRAVMQPTRWPRKIVAGNDPWREERRKIAETRRQAQRLRDAERAVTRPYCDAANGAQAARE